MLRTGSAGDSHFRKVTVALTLCLAVVLAACAAPPAVPPAAEPVYEIIAQDAAYSSDSDEPLQLAISGAQATTSVPAGLPADVVAALQAAASETPAALYIVIYAGVKPGGGYMVAVDSMVLEGDGQSQTLVVTYSETEPEFGGTTALTYPYVIARVLSPSVAADSVRFEQGP